MDGRVTGWMKQRLQLLLAHDINLFAYHLPLDAHPQWGNNAQLGQMLGVAAWLSSVSSCWAAWPMPTLPMRRPWRTMWTPCWAGRPRWVSCAIARAPWPKWRGARAGRKAYSEAAIAAGADVFITGEISEPQAHLARETGVAFIAAGHHATERYGAPAVAGEVARLLGIEHEFIEIDNPA